MPVPDLHFAVHCYAMLSLNHKLNPTLPALNKGGGGTAEVGRYLLKVLYIRGGGCTESNRKWHVVTYVKSMQRHIHIHKKQHTTMLRML
jgi:hypothetical protein